MTDQFRALCAELVDVIEQTEANRQHGLPLRIVTERLDRARALLAQPVAEEPSASNVTELFYRHMGEGSEVGFENAIAEALARWGRPTLQPVAVSERLQQLEDLAADAVSGLRYIEQTHGRLYGVGWDRVYEKADRLQPANALPTPETTND